MVEDKKIRYREFIIEKTWISSTHTEWVFYSENSGGETSATGIDLNDIIDEIDEMIIVAKADGIVL